MSTSDTVPRLIPLEAYGVRFAMGAHEPDLFELLAEAIPPGAVPCAPEEVEHTILLLREDSGYRVMFTGGGGQMRCYDVKHAMALLDGQVRLHLAVHSPDRFFVHAGAVAVDDAAIVLPGVSMTGKSSLVTALVERGATYYSDEYAVLDGDGRVHPYARPVAIHGQARTYPAVRGDKPIRVGVVARVPYRSGGSWRTAPMTSGRGMVMLLEYALSAHERPTETLGALRRSLQNAVFLDGQRGEAAEAAVALMELARGGGR